MFHNMFSSWSCRRTAPTAWMSGGTCAFQGEAQSLMGWKRRETGLSFKVSDSHTKIWTNFLEMMIFGCLLW